MESNCRFDICQRFFITISFADYHPFHAQWISDIAISMLFYYDLKLPGHFMPPLNK